MLNELARYDFIKNVRVSDNGDFRESWAAAADSLYELDKTDREIIKSVGLSLGNSDIRGQLSMLEANSALLCRNADEAREQYIKKGKLYRSCGVLGGLFAAIMIM